MRERFGDWGSELSETEFACALAAAGMLPRAAEPSWSVERLAAAIRDQVRRGEYWRFEEWQLAFDARSLVEVWLLVLRRSREFPIEIDPLGLLSLPFDWVKEQLSRPEVGADSVRIAVTGMRPPVSKERDDQSQQKGTQSYATESESRRPPRGRAIENPASQPRFLQAQLYDQNRPGLRVRAGLVPGRTYVATIRVGLPGPGWLHAERPLTLPEEIGPQGHELTVIFWEPQVSPEPQVQPLLLPPEGNSDPVAFHFEIQEGIDSIAARVTVLHANRVLQTGILRALVGADSRWTFGLDAAPRALLEGLDGRSHFDLALVLNHDDRGSAHLTAASDGQAVVLALDDGPVNELTESLNRQISEIAQDPDRYLGLESPGSVELLRSLARTGATVYSALTKHTHLPRLSEAGRIHITSAKAESFLPIELLYRFETPKPMAGLCPHAAAGLESGDCQTACPSDKRQTVCPLGFWGLSRVIERHAHLPEDQDRINKDFALRAEPVRERSLLPLSKISLLAASDKASEEKKDAVSDLLAKLRARGSSVLAATWQEWEQHVVSDLPGLLVLLPHHERKGSVEILAIGEDERLESADILEEVIRKVPDGPRPIVLLMGCETNLTRISFDNPVSRFQDHGAALVVSTIATVLGRHASPATALLIELLDQMSAPGDRTFGDIMLRLRQKLVATQTPMALGLTAYGDADWILTKEG